MKNTKVAALVILATFILSGCSATGKMNKMLEQDFGERKQKCTAALEKVSDEILGLNNALDAKKYLDLRTQVPNVRLALDTNSDCVAILHKDVEEKRKEIGIPDEAASEAWSAWAEAELKKQEELDGRWDEFIETYELATRKRADGLLKDLASDEKDVTYADNLAGYKKSIADAEKLFSKAHGGQEYLERLNKSVADSERMLEEIEEQKYEEAARTLLDLYIDLRAIYWESFLDDMMVPGMMIGETDRKKSKSYMYAGDMHGFMGKLLEKWEPVHAGLVLGLVMVGPQPANREILRRLTETHASLDEKYKVDVYKNLMYLKSKVFEKILVSVREQEYHPDSKETVAGLIKPYFEEKKRLMEQLDRKFK